MGIFDKDTERARSEHKRVTRTAGFLTEKNGLGGFELKICFSCNPGEKNEQCGRCIHFQEAIERLGEYEALGLSPKEVAKLKKRFTPEFDPKDPDLAEKVDALEGQNDDKN